MAVMEQYTQQFSDTSEYTDKDLILLAILSVQDLRETSVLMSKLMLAALLDILKSRLNQEDYNNVLMLLETEVSTMINEGNKKISKGL